MSVSRAVSNCSSYALAYPPNSQGPSAVLNHSNSRSFSPLTSRSSLSPPLKESASVQRGRSPQKNVKPGDEVECVARATAATLFVSPVSSPQQFQSVSNRDATVLDPNSRLSNTLHTTEDVSQVHKMAVDKRTPAVVSRILNALAVNLDKEIQEFTGVSLEDYSTIASVIEERSSKLIRTPRLTYFTDQGILIVEMPSAVHEAPIAEFLALLVRFQQANYPRSLVRVYVTSNQDFQGSSISAVPDLTLVFSTLKNLIIRRNPFIFETAFTQSTNSVFDKVKGLIKARPEVLMVVVVLIDEETPYESPLEASRAWNRFRRDADPLEIEDFIAGARPQPERQEAFTSPVVIAGHTWCSIKHVDYYVWLRNPSEDRAIVLDPETIEQTEWSAHGVLPGAESDMEHVKATVNRGLELIRSYLVRFCEEAAARNSVEARLESLEQPITLPDSWDHFRTALFDARNSTAHDRYMRWYKDNFRGKKRSRSNDSFVPSDTSIEASGSGAKRLAGDR